MQILSKFRNLGREAVRRHPWLGEAISRLHEWTSAATEWVAQRGIRPSFRSIPALLGIVVAAGIAFYGLGFAFSYEIADDPAFEPPADFATADGSRAVAMAAALVDREINDVGWVSNNTWLSPISLSDNMPNYQQGVVSASARFVIEMLDQLGRTRGSSQSDPDLEKAAGLLKYAPDVWYINLSTSVLPTAPTESQYGRGVEYLQRYNARLASGEAIYDLRADNLIGLLERIAADLGSASATLERQALASNAGWFDSDADDVLYRIKGQLYAYHMILKELGKDAEAQLKAKDASVIWQQMLDSLREGARMDPLAVSNGSQDGFLMPSHLTALGFYLLRGRTQLREVVSVLIR